MWNEKLLNIKKDPFLIIAFVLFGLVPLSSQKVEAIITALFIILSITHSIINRNKKGLNKKYYYLINASLFFVLLITLKDGIDIDTYKKLEQMFSLLIFPIVFFLLTKEGEKKNKALFELWKSFFVLSTFILTLICFFLISNYSNTRYPNLDANFFQNAIIDSSYFSRHPAYIAIYLNISIIICLSWILKSTVKKNIVIYSFLLLIFLTLLLMFSVKMAIIALVISCSVLLFLSLSFKKFFFKTLLFLLIPITLFVLLAPKKYNRFSELFKTEILNEKTEYNSIFIHKKTIICAAKIFKKNLLFGVGIENSNKLINKCVRDVYKHNPNVIYNSHNQYLSYSLHGGIIGLFFLCLVIYFGLSNTLLKEHVLFVLLLYFSVIFLTENVLERQSGLILFAFFINIIPNIISRKQ